MDPKKTTAFSTTTQIDRLKESAARTTPARTTDNVIRCRRTSTNARARQDSLVEIAKPLKTFAIQILAKTKVFVDWTIPCLFVIALLVLLDVDVIKVRKQTFIIGIISYPYLFFQLPNWEMTLILKETVIWNLTKSYYRTTEVSMISLHWNYPQTNRTDSYFGTDMLRTLTALDMTILH